MIDQVRALLNDPQVKHLIEDENLTEVFGKCPRQYRKDLTEHLLSCGVQPDEYMQNIPSDFLNTSQISSYSISPTVGVIGAAAFYNCSSLESITIPDSVTSIGDDAFFGCSSLTSITIPDSVRSIGEYAFCRCYHLTSITLPDGVTSIRNYTFCFCSRLTSITIPSSVTSIGSCAFSGCAGIEIYFNGTQKQWKTITKPEAFKHNYYIVHCADGDIIID